MHSSVVGLCHFGVCAAGMAEVGIGILVQCKPRCLFAGCAARGLSTPITKHTVETVFTASTVGEGARLVFAKWRRDDLLAAAALGHRLGCKFLHGPLPLVDLWAVCLMRAMDRLLAPSCFPLGLLGSQLGGGSWKCRAVMAGCCVLMRTPRISKQCEVSMPGCCLLWHDLPEFLFCNIIVLKKYSYPIII